MISAMNAIAKNLGMIASAIARLAKAVEDHGKDL